MTVRSWSKKAAKGTDQTGYTKACKQERRERIIKHDISIINLIYVCFKSRHQGGTSEENALVLVCSKAHCLSKVQSLIEKLLSKYWLQFRINMYVETYKEILAFYTFKCFKIVPSNAGVKHLRFYQYSIFVSALFL